MKFLWFNLQVGVQGNTTGATCQRLRGAVKYAGTFSTNPFLSVQELEKGETVCGVHGEVPHSPGGKHTKMTWKCV